MGTVTHAFDPFRRHLIAGAAIALASGGAAVAAAPPVVTILGDSITAGYGLPAAQALPAQLQGALTKSGVTAVVRGAGVSGDTTAGALARVDFSVQADTAVCVIELGGNDFLQSVSPAEIERNRIELVEEFVMLCLDGGHQPLGWFKVSSGGLNFAPVDIRVVLAGGRVPESIAGAYGRDLAAIYPRVAKETGATLSGDLLAGVFDNTALRQTDGLHPNAAGAKLVAERPAPAVSKVLRQVRR